MKSNYLRLDCAIHQIHLHHEVFQKHLSTARRDKHSWILKSSLAVHWKFPLQEAKRCNECRYRLQMLLLWVQAKPPRPLCRFKNEQEGLLMLTLEAVRRNGKRLALLDIPLITSVQSALVHGLWQRSFIAYHFIYLYSMLESPWKGEQLQGHALLAWTSPLHSSQP